MGTTLFPAIAIVIALAALGYFGLKRWLSRSGEFDFEPDLDLNRQGGWTVIDLILMNHSTVPVWTESATFAFADLDADFQGGTPSEQCTLLLRETVEPGETLRLGLIETLYNCAGKPQGEYSFLISGMVRYRAGNNWFEISLQTYRVRMVALTAVRLLRMHWYDRPNAPAGSAGGRLRKVSGTEQDWAQRH